MPLIGTICRPRGCEQLVELCARAWGGGGLRGGSGSGRSRPPPSPLPRPRRRNGGRRKKNGDLLELKTANLTALQFEV